MSTPTYYSKYHERDVHELGQQNYLTLTKLLMSVDQERYEWYDTKGISFILTSTARSLVTIRRQNKGKLRFRSIVKTTPSFPVRCEASANGKRPSRIYLKPNGKLQIPSLGDVKLGGYPKNLNLSGKKQTAQVNFDGKYWYLVFSENVDTTLPEIPDFTEGLGVDLGIKTLATMSDGTLVENVRNRRRVRILERRLKILQRKVSRKYLLNKCNKHNKTKNIIKLERQIRLLHRRLKNIRLNHIREFVSKLVKKQPMFIALEDLNVKGMMKNKYLAKHIAFASFYTIREHIIRKAQERHIAVRLVDRFYPSSKTCSSCGSYKKDWKLSDRVYSCTSCGSKIDRDFNAACNLANTSEYVLA